MFFDKKENLKHYASLGKNFETAVRWLLETDLHTLPLGTHEIDGRNVYVMVQEYTTKDRADCRMELHKNYTDIQYILTGGEYMAYVPKKLCTPETDYDEARDICFCSYDHTEALIYVSNDNYCIFTPEDGHVGSFDLGTPADVRKILVKVKNHD